MTYQGKGDRAAALTVSTAAGVPGPASLGVLAIGAAGVLKRRKRVV